MRALFRVNNFLLSDLSAKSLIVNRLVAAANQSHRRAEDFFCSFADVAGGNFRNCEHQFLNVEHFALRENLPADLAAAGNFGTEHFHVTGHCQIARAFHAARAGLFGFDANDVSADGVENFANVFLLSLN